MRCLLARHSSRRHSTTVNARRYRAETVLPLYTDRRFSYEEICAEMYGKAEQQSGLSESLVLTSDAS